MGSVFEIVTLGVLSPLTNIQPTKHNQAGYDAVINLSDDKRIRLSIKNFATSSHYTSFRFQCDEIEKEFVGMLKQANLRATQLYVDFKTYTNKLLKEKSISCIKDLVDSFKNRPVHYEDDDIYIGLGSLTSERQYSDQFNSYETTFISTFHKNEKQNLYSKIEEAINNLTKHGGLEDNENINMVFIHINPHVHVNDCAKWIYEYYEQFPEKPISVPTNKFKRYR